MVMTLRLSSSRRRGIRQIHRGRQKRANFTGMSSHVEWFFSWHPRNCPQGIRTPWSNPQWQVLLWGFEAAEGGHSAQTSRQVEEKQLVSPPWQRARSHINLSTIPDFQKYYNDSPPPIFAWPQPCDFFVFPKMKLRPKGRRFDTTEEIHAESQDFMDTPTFDNFQGCVKSRGRTLGSLYTRPRGLLRRRRWKLGVTVRPFSMVKFPEFLGSPTYSTYASTQHINTNSKNPKLICTNICTAICVLFPATHRLPWTLLLSC